MASIVGTTVVEAPKGRRDEFVEPYFKRAKPDAVVLVLCASSRCQRSAGLGLGLGEAADDEVGGAQDAERRGQMAVHDGVPLLVRPL